MKTWVCQRDGSCCRLPKSVVMTFDEARTLANLSDKATRQPQFLRRTDGFYTMPAGPCPFFRDKACAVYESRPFSCRRFMCARWDVKAEPFRDDPMPMILVDRDLKRSYAKNQAKHQGWAQLMGWKS